MLHATQHQITEWAVGSNRPYEDPFNEVDVEFSIKGPGGQTWRVPAYWSGGQQWRVRFAPLEIGRYQYQSLCTDASNTDLHGVKGTLEVFPTKTPNPLFQRGSLQPASSCRTLEHADGTPFFWLGDTWWMGLCKRFSWPEDFQLLTADRVKKGFTVIQIVAGLYPDMPGLDPRSANEAGFAWEEDYARINPCYFDMADLRIGWLVRAGLLPCIVGCWGYYLPLLGIEKMKKHWRYLIARWGAYPVVWCAAGEAAMPYYLSEDKEGDSRRQTEGWTEMTQYIRETDPFKRLITIHAPAIGRDQINDASALGLDMIQAGHGGAASVERSISLIAEERKREPKMPVVVAEVNYEGILHGTGEETQRWNFWAAFLSGTAGHTYGANGLWQANTKEAPHGPSPHGADWGDTLWENAYRLPGCKQLALAKRLLERYRWWEFEPHPDWVDPSGSAERPGAGAL